MSHYHFVALSLIKRLLQLGEEEWRIKMLVSRIVNEKIKDIIRETSKI